MKCAVNTQFRPQSHPDIMNPLFETNTGPKLALSWMMMMRSYFLNQDHFMEMTGWSKLISRHHYLDPRKEDGSETANIWFLFWDD